MTTLFVRGAFASLQNPPRRRLPVTRKKVDLSPNDGQITGGRGGEAPAEPELEWTPKPNPGSAGASP